jgi:hypothetical protein
MDLIYFLCAVGLPAVPELIMLILMFFAVLIGGVAAKTECNAIIPKGYKKTSSIDNVQ